jgi:hypothetical protein
MIALGGYMPGRRGQVCVVPKLSRVIVVIFKTLLPREKSCPSNGTFTCLGSLEDAHHRARAMMDTCIRQASSTMLKNKLPDSYPKLYINVVPVPISIYKMCPRLGACLHVGR